MGDEMNKPLSPEEVVAALAPHLPRQKGRPPTWHGEKLEQLRKAYLGKLKLEAVSQDFEIPVNTILHLAKVNKWPRRRPS